MKKIHLTMILSISFLSACQTSKPLVLEDEECQTFFSIDANGDIDLDRSFCRCRDYKLSLDFIGATTKSIRKPISYCHESIGRSVRGRTRLINFYEAVASEIKEADSVLMPEIHDENQD